MIAYCSITGNQADAVCSYDVMVELLNILTKNTEAKLVCADLHEPNYEFYNDAYYIEYADNEFWVGKMLLDNGAYVSLSADKVWVEDEYLDKYIVTNGASNATVFCFDESNDDITQTPCLCLDKDKLGFTHCYSGDDGYEKFRYRGTEKLTDKKAWEIVGMYCNCND